MATVTPADVARVQGTAGMEVLVKEIDKLVSLPDIYYRLEDAIVNPQSTTDSIASLLGTDPDLCARLLRMANSAFYSFPTEIETVERAVSNIGLRQTRELVLVTSVVKAFEGIPTGLVNMAMFWEHSVAVGVMARELAKQARLPKVESYYIPGLLHDIGRLVMYLKLPGLVEDLLQQRVADNQKMYLLEQDVLDYSHADLGGRLLEHWRVPQSIWEPVIHHHQPARGGDFAIAAAVVHVADVWVNLNLAGSSGTNYDMSIAAEALELVTLDESSIEQAGRAAAEQVNAIVRQFLGH